MFGEKKKAGGWKRPHRFLGRDGETCRVDFPNGPVSLRSTVVKEYHFVTDQPIDSASEPSNVVIDNEIPKSPLEDNADNIQPRRNPRRKRERQDE